MLWRHEDADGASGFLTDDGAGRALDEGPESVLVSYRAETGRGPLTLQIDDSCGGENRVSFLLLSVKSEQSLERELSSWGRGRDTFTTPRTRVRLQPLRRAPAGRRRIRIRVEGGAGQSPPPDKNHQSSSPDRKLSAGAGVGKASAGRDEHPLARTRNLNARTAGVLTPDSYPPRIPDMTNMLNLILLISVLLSSALVPPAHLRRRLLRRARVRALGRGGVQAGRGGAQTGRHRAG